MGISWLFGNNILTLSILCRPLSQKSSEMEYINKYRQLEVQQFDMYGSEQSTSGPGKQVFEYREICVSCSHVKTLNS